MFLHDLTSTMLISLSIADDSENDDSFREFITEEDSVTTRKGWNSFYADYKFHSILNDVKLQ